MVTDLPHVPQRGHAQTKFWIEAHGLCGNIIVCVYSSVHTRVCRYTLHAPQIAQLVTDLPHVPQRGHAQTEFWIEAHGLCGNIIVCVRSSVHTRACRYTLHAPQMAQLVTDQPHVPQRGHAPAELRVDAHGVGGGGGGEGKGGAGADRPGPPVPEPEHPACGAWVGGGGGWRVVVVVVVVVVVGGW